MIIGKIIEKLKQKNDIANQKTKQLQLSGYTVCIKDCL